MNKTVQLNKIAFIVLLMAFSVMSFGQKSMAEKVLIKSFNLQGNEIVSLDLGEPIEVQTWGKSTVRVQMNISLKNGTNVILKSLVQSGKYNLKSTIKEEIFYINSSDLRKQMVVGGTPLVEKISIMVFVPENVLVLGPDGSEWNESL